LADFEHVWQSGIRQKVEAYRKEAYKRSVLHVRAFGNGDAANHAWRENSARWYSSRAGTMELPRRHVLAACEGRFRVTRCGCATSIVPVGCDQPLLCAWCRKRHWRRWNRRLARGLSAHLRAAQAAWSRSRRGLPPGIYLLTLTGPHSGDVERDRVVLAAAWRKFYKHANREGWFTTFAKAHETTSGTKGEGHVHLHVAIIASWLPYEQLHEAWRRALPGARVLNVQAPNRGRSQSGSAAKYLAKYVSKGTNLTDFDGETAARLLLAERGRRKVTTSKAFYVPPPSVCRDCGQRHVTMEQPEGFAAHARMRNALFPPTLSTPPPPQKSLRI
jgi:hypothetical protein